MRQSRMVDVFRLYVHGYGCAGRVSIIRFTRLPHLFCGTDAGS